MPNKAHKITFNWRKTHFLLPRFSLLCRQHSSLQAFLDQKNGRKQKCNLIDVTLDDVTMDIKQIYNMMLFPIKPPGGLFISSHLRWAPEGWNFTCWDIWEGWQICHFGWWKDPKGPADAILGWQSRENVPFLQFINSLDTVHLQQLKACKGFN